MLVKFNDGESEVLIETRNIAYIWKGAEAVDYYNPRILDKPTITKVIIHFTRNVLYSFIGKDAEAVWDYFTKEVKNGFQS